MQVRALCGQALLIKIGGLQMLVDTPLDFVGLLGLTPRCLHTSSQVQTLSYDSALYETVDSEALDVVMVSNIHTVQGLPMLFPHCHARVLMTDPVAKLGRAVCEELISLDEEMRLRSLEKSKLYGQAELAQAWRQVQELSFGQVIRINEVEIRALSAGHSLGSANWLITWGDFKTAVISHSCMDANRYPAEFDQAALRADLLLFSPRLQPVILPFHIQAKALYEALLEVCRSNNMQSVVLIPLNPWLFLDLQSRLVSVSAAFHLPIYCVSQTVKAFCACAAGSTEWLNQDLKHKSYGPHSAFPFEAAIESKSLRIYQDLKESFGSEFKEPCIVLVTHSSLRLGEAEYILSYLANQGKAAHSIFFIDADHPMEPCIAPYRAANWTRKLKLTQSDLRIGLTVQDTRELITKSVAGQCVLPVCFQIPLDQIAGKILTYYSSDDPVTLLRSSPTGIVVRSSASISGVVFGTVNYRDYAYTVDLISVADLLRDGLVQLGVSAEVEERGDLVIVRAQEGRAELSPRGITLRAQSPDFRKVLLRLVRRLPRND